MIRPVKKRTLIFFVDIFDKIVSKVKFDPPVINMNALKAERRRDDVDDLMIWGGILISMFLFLKVHLSYGGGGLSAKNAPADVGPFRVVETVRVVVDQRGERVGQNHLEGEY